MNKIKEKLSKIYLNFLIFIILLKHIIIVNYIFKKLRNNIYMKFEKNGQMSLEFLLISFISIIIFISITLPLTNIAIESISDSINSIETKSEILKIVNCIDAVYSDGIGSKRAVFIEVPVDTTINFYQNTSSNFGIASGNINLRNNNKIINVDFKANNVESSIFLRKKFNTKVIIEWSNINDKISVKV